MLRIADAIISLDVIEKKFSCDLKKCRGECCVRGDSGAPLEPEEILWLEKELEMILPFLRPEGVTTIRRLGSHVIDSDKDYVTPLIGGKECAFVVYEDNIARCGIQNAYLAGKTSYPKPLSCHLYPLRLKKYPDFVAVNYEQWDICEPARAGGNDQNMPVYRFVKTALERKFGKKWYRTLESVHMKMTRNSIRNP